MIYLVSVEKDVIEGGNYKSGTYSRNDCCICNEDDNYEFTNDLEKEFVCYALYKMDNIKKN